MMGVHVETFKITFDQEDTSYREGDTISGKVTISNEEDLKYKVIFLELRGMGVVVWNSDEIEYLDLDPDQIKGDCNKELFFHKKVTLMEKDKSFLEKDDSLAAGEHTFGFECKLPQELPSSFEGTYGQIKYFARAVIERSWKSSVVTKQMFTVQSGLDLNFIPEAACKIELCKYKNVGGCCNPGSITCDWSVNKSGFVPGEDIAIHGAIQNESEEIIPFSRVALYMVVDYKSKKRRKKEKREIQVAQKGETLPDDVTVWQEVIHIPHLPPTGLGRCKLIDVNYELQFTAVVEGGYTPVSFTKEIYIGTVPMCRREMKSCIAGMYNQPYQSSTDTLDEFRTTHASQLSLTHIVSVAGAVEVKSSPTAPTINTLEKSSFNIEPVVCPIPIDTEINGIERPPPFAPLLASCDTSYDQSCDPSTSPTAPSCVTLNRPWAPPGVSAEDQLNNEINLEIGDSPLSPFDSNLTAPLNIHRMRKEEV